MKRCLIVLVLLILSVSPVLAQTDTPTPTPTPTATPIPALPVPEFDLIASPTAMATYESATLEAASGLPVNQVYDYLATAYIAMNSAPSDITHPNGQPILPDVEIGTLFSFAKWFLDPVTADQLAGPFAPLLFYFGVYFGLVIVMSGIYLIAVVIRAILRWVLFIYAEITKLIP